MIRKSLIGFLWACFILCITFAGNVSACSSFMKPCTSDADCCQAAGKPQNFCRDFYSAHACAPQAAVKAGQHWVGNYYAPDAVMQVKKTMDITIDDEESFIGTLYRWNHSKKSSVRITNGRVDVQALLGALTGSFEFAISDTPALGIINCTYHIAHAGSKRLNVTCLNGIITANLQLQSK